MITKPILLVLLSSSISICDAAECNDYAQQLATMRTADQTLRMQLIDSPTVPRRLGNALETVDRANTARLKSLLQKCGWPIASRYGKEAGADAWLLIQHADRDREFQRAALPLLESAVRAGEARGGDLAYLSDRLSVAEGKPQLYGTQFKGIEDCKLVLAPIDSREAVNGRRHAIPGMPTLEAYEEMANEHMRPPECRGSK